MVASIPKLIHQTFPDKKLPPQLDANAKRLRDANPDWRYQLYDNQDIEDFIAAAYGADVLTAYRRISPRYGAARADLFRYLLMHERGGVYLDMKSSFSRPLSETLTLSEGFVLSKWQNGPGDQFKGSGLHPELAAFPRGEFQQWHIICAPKHPYLAAVIDRVLANIANYRPWRGVGRTGVLRLTGPIAYTLAIEPIKAQHPHVELQTHEEIGLRYSTLGAVDHRPFFKHHYTQLDFPIVRSSGLSRMVDDAYIGARRLKHHLLHPNEEL